MESGETALCDERMSWRLLPGSMRLRSMLVLSRVRSPKRCDKSGGKDCPDDVALLEDGETACNFVEEVVEDEGEG